MHKVFDDDWKGKTLEEYIDKVLRFIGIFLVMIMLAIRKYNSIFYTRNGEVGAVLKRRSKNKNY